MNEAYVTKAIAQAPVNLPDYPAYCYEPTGVVVPKLGEKWRHVEYRHQIVTEQEDVRKRWCHEWYDGRKADARGIQSP